MAQLQLHVLPTAEAESLAGVAARLWELDVEHAALRYTSKWRTTGMTIEDRDARIRYLKTARERVAQELAPHIPNRHHVIIGHPREPQYDAWRDHPSRDQKYYAWRDHNTCIYVTPLHLDQDEDAQP